MMRAQKQGGTVRVLAMVMAVLLVTCAAVGEDAPRRVTDFEKGLGSFGIAAWKGPGKGRLVEAGARAGKRCVQLTGGLGTDDVTVLSWHQPAFRLLPDVEYVVSVWVKTENAHDANLRVSLPKDAGAKGLAQRGVKGTNDWTKLEQRFTVSKAVSPRYFCVWVQGPGKVWVDDFEFAGKTGGLEWEKTVEIDPTGIKTGKEFNELLAKQGVKTGGFVNYFTGRWPYISFIGGMAMGNISEHLEFFYEKPFRYWTHTLDYVMDGGGRKFGIRATIRRYKEQGKVAGRRSFLLWYRCDRLIKDYHPSYILVNGRRIWDAKKHPVLDGKYIVVPFWQEEPGDPVIDFVVDLDHTPELKGLAFRMFNVKYIGESGMKVSLKDAAEQREGSPADKLERFTFGLFPSGYDFWTEEGPRIEDLKKKWKHNFRPDYPVDRVWLSPTVFTTSGRGAYHDFMVTYGGCNLLGANPSPAVAKEGKSYLRGVWARSKDAEAARRIHGLNPNFEAHWGDEPNFAHFGEESEAEHDAQMARERKGWETAKKATGAPERIRWISEPFPPSLAGAHYYERGADVVILKNLDDPQANIYIAMSRGAGRSFGKPFGFYWEQSHYPYPSVDLKLHACLLFYLSGGSWIGAEAENAHSFYKGVVADWVLPYVKALRFAMVHPARETPIIPVGILWGHGDRWVPPYNPFATQDTFLRHLEYDHATRKLTSEPSFVKPLFYVPKDPAKWNFGTATHLPYFIDRVPELKGYDLLDVFLPKYGDAFTARISRLLTGTPYGPVDFTYLNKAPVDLLKSYGVTAVLGHLTLTPDITAKLTASVESGVPLVIGAQHLKGADKQFTGAFGLKIQAGGAKPRKGSVGGAEEFFGKAKSGAFSGKVWSAEGDGWKTVAWIGKDKTPLVLSRTLGKGKVYVYLGEWITEGGAALRPILGKLGERAAPLRFSPGDDQIEYVAYRKGAGAWVALFNHGNIQVGCDRLKELRATPPEPLVSKVKGPWQGEIAFRLARFGLDPKGDFALYFVEGIDGEAFEGVISGHSTFKVKRIPAQRKDGVLHARVTIAKRGQFVIAPEGKGEEVFFGRR